MAEIRGPFFGTRARFVEGIAGERLEPGQPVYLDMPTNSWRRATLVNATGDSIDFVREGDTVRVIPARTAPPATR